jgi:hypothetical protein
MASFGLLSYLGVGVGDFKRGSVGDVEVISKCGNRGGRRGGGFVVDLDVLSLSQIMTYASFLRFKFYWPAVSETFFTFDIFEPGSIHLARELSALLVVFPRSCVLQIIGYWRCWELIVLGLLILYVWSWVRSVETRGGMAFAYFGFWVLEAVFGEGENVVLEVMELNMVEGGGGRERRRIKKVWLARRAH